MPCGVEGDLYNTLNTLVANRCYADIAPAGAAKPYITYQQVGGEAINFLEQVTIPTKKNARFQINVWADTRIQASTLAAQVENAMRLNLALQTTVEGAIVSRYEDNLYGTRQDFSVWFTPVL
jgi:hypothetical protein